MQHLQPNTTLQDGGDRVSALQKVVVLLSEALV